MPLPTVPLCPAFRAAGFVLLALASVHLRAETRILATFADGKDGFEGPLEVDGGAGRIANPDQKWVTVSRRLDDIRNEVLEVAYRVRSKDPVNVAVRLTDATGQQHQQRPQFGHDGAWHAVRIRTLAGGTRYEAWGGAADKRFHHPLTRVEFILEGQGTAWIDDVALSLHPVALVPDLDAKVPADGHVFFGDEEPRIVIRSKAGSVRWRVTDFWRREVAAGELAVAGAEDPGAVLRPGVSAPGYYLATLTAGNTTRHVAFAIVGELAAARPADTPFGVMTHFAQGMSTDILPLLRKLGVTSVRDEHYWDHVERAPGEFAAPPRNVDYMEALRQAGIAPLVAMTFANKLYDDGLTPHTDDGRAAYGRYGQYLLRQWPEQIRWLEIWNEYNGTWCKGPAAEDRPRHYAAMLKTAYEHIKAVRPDVQVLGCATVLVPLPYLEGVFRHGGLRHMDAVVLHPYRGNPEGVDAEVAEVEALIRKYNDGRDKPIWITETGRHDTSEDEWEAGLRLYEQGRRRVASYLVRQYALLMTRNVAKIHWYLCRDYQNFVSMGLLRNVDDPMGKYAVAPAYVAYATLIRQMEGYRFLGRVPAGRMTHLLRFDVGGVERWIVWSVLPETLSFSADGPVSVVDMMGGTHTLHPVSGRIALTLDESPVFVTGLDGVAERPLFVLPSPQTVDLMAEPRVALTVDAEGANLVVDGHAAALHGGAAESVALGLPPALIVGPLALPYELRVGDRLGARGTVRIDVRDPLTLDDVSYNRSEGRLTALLRNASSRQAYRIAGQPFGEIGPGETRRVAWPAAELAAFESREVNVEVACEGRPGIRFRGFRAWTPWGGPHALPLGKVGRRWGAAPPSGSLALEREEAGFRLRGALSGLTPRARLVLALGGSDERYALKQLPIAGDGPVDIAVPWHEIPNVDARSRTVRMALAIYADAGRPAAGVVEWPSGIASGLEPAAFATLLRVGAGDEADDRADAPGEQDAWEAIGSLADSEADYGKTQGHRDGFYGYYDGTGDGEGDGRAPDGPYSDDDFKPMRHVETMWGYEWSGPYRYLTLGPASAHPAAQKGTPVWAVRRWVSPVGGRVRISGRFGVGAKGDGSGLKILVDGVVRHSALVGGVGAEGSRRFDLVVPVSAGSRVDFACTPGAGVNTEYDSSTYAFRIDQVR